MLSAKYIFIIYYDTVCSLLHWVTVNLLLLTIEADTDIVFGHWNTEALYSNTFSAVMIQLS